MLPVGRVRNSRVTVLAVGAALLLAMPSPRAGVAAITSSTGEILNPTLDHFYNLEYDAAEQELNARLKDHPDDLQALCYRARVSMEREMLRRQLLDSQAYGQGGEALRKGRGGAPP